MFKNYFRTAWRSLWKNKFYSIINVTGLAVGLSTGILLLLWVQNELSFDKFNTDYKHIYQFSTHFNSNGQNEVWKGVPGPLAVLAKSVPGVQSIVRIDEEPNQILSNKDQSKIFKGNSLAFVDSGFFHMFNFRLQQGNKATLFPNNNSIVVTQTMAKKLYNTINVMGKIVRFWGNYFTITGVIQDFPENSSIHYDVMASMDYYAQEFTKGGGNGDWKTIDQDLGNYKFITYVKLVDNVNAAGAGKQFSSSFKKIKKDSDASFQLENLADIHFIDADGNTSSLQMVRIFMLVVVLLLAIASINYVNLSTARSLVRAKEVSIRKMVGAQRKQLFFQFIIETVLLFGFAIAVAIVLLLLLLPLYNTISGENFSFNLSNANVLQAAAIAVLGTLVASSIYPAILLSSFRPIEALKGRIKSGIGMVSLRKGLVVFQFSISVILLVCTMVMSNQLNFIKQKDLGYNKSYVFSVPLTDEVISHIDAMKTSLQKQTSIVSAGTSSESNLADIESSTSDLYWDAKPANSNPIIAQVLIDKDFIPTMQMKFVEGGNFSGTPTDTSYYVVNESAVKAMGLKPPYVGQQIGFHDWKGTILGVVKDFNFKSLKESISPLIFFTGRWNPGTLYIRTTAAKAQQAIAATEKEFKKYAGNIPFSYNFLDKTFDDQYKTDERVGTLFNVFAGIAIFISCLGLFGLATYTSQIKIKEIGIRKVLGASVTGIVRLLSTDFLKLVVIAIVIAIPVAWWVMNKWLNDYAYKVTINWWVFAVAGVASLLIALLTISFQAIKAAVTNPVKSLRTE